MNYRVTLDWSPAYELIYSLEAFLFNLPKNLDLGAEWVQGVRAQLHGPIVTLSKWQHGAEPFLLALLVRQSPAPRTVESFLTWLRQLTPGEAYERLLPYVSANDGELLRRLPSTLGEYADLLQAWHEQYFRTVEPVVLERLAAEAVHRRALVATQDPTTAIEEATTGFVVAFEQIDEVLLIPQFHAAPLNFYQRCNRTLVICYPLEHRPEQPGMPPIRLIRIAKALADENRLRILHFLADGQPHTFTEIQRFTGLAKNSVYYHLMTLRPAGLVKVHLTADCCNERYTARRATIDQLGPSLQRYLDDR
jgi:DNA-binding transcriptional ArsR family regulator